MRCHQASCLILLACAVFLLCSCGWIGPGIGPTAVITATPASGSAPLSVRLSGSTSNGGGTIVEYVWEFPDQEAESMAGTQIDMRYEQSGSFSVRLTVIDDSGLSDTQDIVIVVNNVVPIASCRFTNDAPVLYESVLFDASASVDLDGQLVDFIWDFGDGSTRRGTRVSHTYEKIGLYVVQLSVVDNSGAIGTISHTMTVHSGSGGISCGGNGGGGISLSLSK